MNFNQGKNLLARSFLSAVGAGLGLLLLANTTLATPLSEPERVTSHCSTPMPYCPKAQ